MSDIEPTMGHVEEVIEASIAPRVITRRVEEWARIKSTSPVILVAAARYARWECGDRFDPCLVTEKAFDHAVAFAENPYAIANPPKKTEP